jgi:hypothetical protein
MELQSQDLQQSTVLQAHFRDLRRLSGVALVAFIVGLGSGFVLYGRRDAPVQSGMHAVAVRVPGPTTNHDPTVALKTAVTNRETLTPTSTAADGRRSWKVYEDQYIRIQYPASWLIVVVDEGNGQTHELESLMLSGGGPFGESYEIRILGNPTGKDAMAFARDDVVTNWERTSGPTYRPYPLKNRNAVLVDNINAGKGAWGPFVYVVSRTLAVQIISVDPLDDPNKFFNPMVKTLSIVDSK